jgi:MinD-like ATPase involved in chromosome partitioning or flagellar assembly
VSRPTRVATVAGDSHAEESVAALLAGSREVELVLRCVDRVELLAVLRSGTIDAVISVGVPVWLDRQIIEEAAERSIKLVGLPSDPLEAERLRGWGVVLGPLDPDASALVALCDDAPSALPPPPSPPRTESGRLVAVWGPKGSPGRSTIAIELAALISKSEPQTLLVDADPYGGDLLQLLGVIEELPTTVWAARLAAKEELDMVQIAGSLRRSGEAGPILLPGVPRAEMSAEISEFAWKRLLGVLRSEFRYSICDVGFCLEPGSDSFSDSEGRNHITRSTLRAADTTVAVCNASPTGIKHFLWAFEHLIDLVNVDDVVVVANRVSAGETRDVGDIIKRHTGKRPIAYVPERHAEFRERVSTGIAMAEQTKPSDVTRSLDPVITAIGGYVAPHGVLARLGGRR